MDTDPATHEAALAETARIVSQTAKALQVEIRVLRRTRQVERRVYAVVAVLLLLMSGLTAAGVLDARNRSIESRQRGLQNQQVLRNTEQTAQILLDCIDAGGKCKARQDANTAKVLGQLVAANAAVARCTVTATDAATYDACVAKVTKGN